MEDEESWEVIEELKSIKHIMMAVGVMMGICAVGVMLLVNRVVFFN